MEKFRKSLIAVLTTAFLLGTAGSALGDVEQINMALNVESQAMYLAIRTDCDFEGYFTIEPESLVVAGYDSLIDCGDFCMPDYTCLANFEVQIVPGLPPGELVTFYVDIFDMNSVLVGSTEDELEVQEGPTRDDNYYGYRDECEYYVPDEVSTHPQFDFCMWLCHRTYIIPVVCHEPLQDIPMFRIRPGCDEDIEIDPEHQYSNCSWDTCTSIANDSVLSWHVTILDTTNCVAFLVIIYCDRPPGCACLKAPDWILPVELSDFAAVAGDGYVDLSWTTASELNNDHFNILRRTVNRGWATIAQREGQGTTSSPYYYSYRDGAVVNNVTYQYVLESVDINTDRHTYDMIVTATPHATGVPTAYALRQNYPNPFNASTSFEFALPEGGFVSLKIYDLLGREVATVVEGNLEAERYHVTWSADGLPSGIYLYTLNAGEFTQTRKMLFLK